MTVHYFDPSAWVKRYFQETGSESVNALFRKPVAAACCRLGVVEIIATIARKSDMEALDPSTVATLLESVRADFSAFEVVPVDEPRITIATDMALRHRLRTMDAIHLSCALSLRTFGETILISSDIELLAAAAQEGLATLDPAATAA